MASLQWNDHIRVVVSEMSWKQQLEASADFLAWMQDEAPQQEQLQRQAALAVILILHSRISVYRDNVLLENGRHEIDDGVFLTLPLTKSGLEDLPVSIVKFLLISGQEVNPQTIASFLDGLTAMTAQISATL